MSTFECIIAVLIGIVVCASVFGFYNHFKRDVREYRKMNKDMKSGWML
jgi:hypothetical protein